MSLKIESQQAQQLILLESVRTRTAVAPISIVASFLTTILFTPFLVAEEVSWARICLWVFPFFLSTIARTYYSIGVHKDIEAMSQAQLETADKWLRFSSIVNQTLLSTGIWIIYSPTNDTIAIPIFVTMTIVVFTFGAMSNLVSDPKSFRLSVPIPIVQVIVFWVLQGGPGYSIGVAVVSALILIFVVHGRMYQLFCESVLIRYEKDQLLVEVEAEKDKTEVALEAVQAANASKAFFMAAASHDIKQPLYAVGLLTDTLLMKPQPAETIEILEKQRRSIDRMNALFDDLMDVTRFEQGVFEIEVAEFSSEELSQTLADEFETLCLNKNIDWQIDIESVQIRSDLHLLIRLCRNLLSNALAYCSEGGIGCHARVNGSNLCFRIFDSGIGIAPEHQDRVFDQFVRISGQHSDRTGAGLGLTIVSHIRDALGIHLEMQSELGSGTEFTFGIPLAG